MYNWSEYFVNFTDSSTCQVIEQVTQNISECIFPFILHGKTFTECTDYLDQNGNLWCSTQTNPGTQEHKAGGYWGYCEDALCPKKNGKLNYSNQVIKIMLIEVSKRNIHMCVRFGSDKKNQL